MTLKVLLVIPHVFQTKAGSLYSSQTEEKRDCKKKALYEAINNNIGRLGERNWIHASLGKGKPIVTREMEPANGIDLKIQVYTPDKNSLIREIPKKSNVDAIDPKTNDFTKVPLIAARNALEQSENYDVVGYLEDDIAIEDRDFFEKILWLGKTFDPKYVCIPHRCEYIQGKGDVILSGDPDGGRPDLFWDTGETIKANWPIGEVKFYRATNPHSGCWFLNKNQAIGLAHYWSRKNWIAEYQLSGPLEQAASGLLLPIFHIMKPVPNNYRFLMVRHLDSLWERHRLENGETMEALI